jgi:pSer/pThr/pTyr-binding forkhead associated (FHA) protein
MALVPVLVGIGGPFKGEVHALEHLRTYIVGRSREADISVRRTEIFRLQNDNERDYDKAAKTISGKHFQIVFYNISSVEIRNLSPNGTYVDGQPVTSPLVIKDVATKSHDITFGADAKFRLEAREAVEK